jgi:ribosome biogenesis GTPase
VLLPRSGIVIDTPGMREIQLWETGGALTGTFGDIEALAGACRFRDCRHRQEPGCAVREAVERGDLPAGRVESYHKLQDEQAHHARQLDQRLQLEQKRHWKSLTKAGHKRIREKYEGS